MYIFRVIYIKAQLKKTSRGMEKIRVIENRLYLYCITYIIRLVISLLRVVRHACWTDSLQTEMNFVGDKNGLERCKTMLNFHNGAQYIHQNVYYLLCWNCNDH